MIMTARLIECAATANARTGLRIALPSVSSTNLNASNRLAARLSKTHPVLQLKRRLQSDPRCQVRTLTTSIFAQGRALCNKAAHSPLSKLSNELVQLGAAGWWNRVWALLHNEWTTAKRDPDIECMKQLIEHALAGQNSQAAIRLVQKLTDMNARNRRVASILTDDWIAGVLRSALGLAAVSGSDQKHPFVDITSALFMIEHQPRGKKPRYSESRVLMCANQLLSGESTFDTDYIAAELKAATAKYVQPDKNEINSQPWSLNCDKINDRMPYPQLKSWYKGIYARREIPSVKHIAMVLYSAVKYRDDEFWETIVHKHFPEILIGLTTVLPKNDIKRTTRYYKRTVWSSAIDRHASRKEFVTVAEYFGRLASIGSYPKPDACGDLLGVLDEDTQLPVLPLCIKHGAPPICGMDPVYHPQGNLPDDTLIVAKSPAHRKKLLAEMGLAMLYSLLHYKQWPTTYFFGGLFGLLYKAKMLNDLQHVFEVVMPAALRMGMANVEMPHRFMIGPSIWTAAIQCAIENDDLSLAKRWFEDYRLNIMPSLREQNSLFHVWLSPYSEGDRLAALAVPYYSAANIALPLTSDGQPPMPWYDLQRVELLLEMDQMREQDNLPRPFDGAFQLLQIFIEVDEYRDVEKAEGLAKYILTLPIDVEGPHTVRPKFYELAWSFKLILEGYSTILKKQLDADIKSQPDIAKTMTRIKYWFDKWNDSFEKAAPGKHTQIWRKTNIPKTEQIFLQEICHLLDANNK